MVKKKIVLCVFLALVITSFSIVSFAANVPVEYNAQSLTVWNVWSVKTTQNFAGTTSVVNWADAKDTETDVTVAFNFPMLPYLAYSITFDIQSDNDTRYEWFGRGTPIGTYVSSEGLLKEKYSEFAEAVYSSQRALGCKVTQTNSSASGTQNGLYRFEAVIMSTVELDDNWWKAISLAPQVTKYNEAERSFKMSMSGVTIYYDSETAGGATLEQIADNKQAIEKLGIKVDTINSNIGNLSKQLDTSIKNVQSQVSAEGQETRADIAAARQEAAKQAEETKNTINENGNKVNESIKDLPNQQEKIEQGHIEEGNKNKDDNQSKFNNELGEADGLSNVDVSQYFKLLWDNISSEEVATSFTFPKAEIFGFTLWDAVEVDFSPWLNDTYISALLNLVKLVLSIGLVFFIVRFYSALITAILNPNSEKSVFDVLFDFNLLS